MPIFLIADMGDDSERMFTQSKHATVTSAHKKYKRLVKRDGARNGFCVQTDNESLYNLVERTDDEALFDLFYKTNEPHGNMPHKAHLLIQIDKMINITCFNLEHIFEYDGEVIHWDELFQLLRIDSLGIINVR